MATAGIDFANWDLTDFFPEFLGPEHRAFRDDCATAIADLSARVKALGPLTEESATNWAKLLLLDEQLWARLDHLECYVGALVAGDTRDEAFQAEMGRCGELRAEYHKAAARVLAAIKGADEAAFEKLLACPDLKGAEHSLRRKRRAAALTMTADQEELAADLSVSGMVAWGRLAQKIAGSLEFDLKHPDGTIERVPMSRRRSLLEHPSAAIRKAALEGSNAAWAERENVMAAALNSIAGTRLTLQKRRCAKHFLDGALFESNMSRATLDAMMSAIAKRREIPQRFLWLKAKLLGKEKLGFQDQYAPLPVKTQMTARWDRAQARLERAFGKIYPAFGDFCREAFAKNWIESELRAGKAPGAYCAASPYTGQARIFMNYGETFTDSQIIAHELGHAYHNKLLGDMRPWARELTMALAETPSTFAEILFLSALLNDPEVGEDEKVALLDIRMKEAVRCLLSIPAYYYFEKAFYEERARGEVSVSRLKELTLAAQRESFGDSLAEDELDPLVWASRGLFYLAEMSFYNFPYSFGYLFGLGLFARFQKEGSSFLGRYEDLLRLTGSDTAEGIARRALGVDIERESFWLDSLSLVEEDLARFEEIMPRLWAETVSLAPREAVGEK
jgi:oligoendopeptidase F